MLVCSNYNGLKFRILVWRLTVVTFSPGGLGGRSHRDSLTSQEACGVRKGTNGNGSALMGSLQISFFDRGTFWVLPLAYFYPPKSARAYLFV